MAGFIRWCRRNMASSAAKPNMGVGPSSEHQQQHSEPEDEGAGSPTSVKGELGSQQQQQQQPEYEIGHGHYFTKRTFHKPTYCHHCTDMLWGLIGQGYICEGEFLGSRVALTPGGIAYSHFVTFLVSKTEARLKVKGTVGDLRLSCKSSTSLALAARFFTRCLPSCYISGAFHSLFEGCFFFGPRSTW